MKTAVSIPLTHLALSRTLRVMGYEQAKFYKKPTKKCGICGEEKTLDNFYVHKRGGFVPYCKPCGVKMATVSGQWRRMKEAKDHSPEMRAKKKREYEMLKTRQLKYVQRNRDFVWEYLKSHPCVDCGGTNLLTLEFDHIDGEKIRNMTYYTTYPTKLENLKAEIAKCVIRCANCHRKVTRERKGDWRFLRNREETT